MASTVQKWVQKDRTAQADDASFSDWAQAFIMSVGATIYEAPPYWSPRRDEWLWKFWHRTGNDILAGALSTMVAKVVAASWYIEGPLTIATAYRNALLHGSNFGDGWDRMIPPWVMSYLSRDSGGLCERHRTSATDQDGPALGFAHLDESKCRNRKDPEYPIRYNDGDTWRKLHRSHVMKIVDLPDGRENYYGIGFCSVSRAISTALILMDIVRYKRERLSDLPPAALLILSNLTDQQWGDIMSKYDARQRNEGNTTWRDILVICGIDPAYKTEADLFEFSSLPEHYDERTCTEIAVYTFALALRMAPREIWPVTGGPLGTATEAEIQYRKAKAKGEGIIFAMIERQLNSPLSLPQSIRFRFDFRDDEDDMQKAEIDHQKLQNIRLMWESSPNRGEPEGIITTEEARRWAALERIVPSGIMKGVELDEAKLYDIRMWGPWVRVYRDGSILRM